MARMRRYEGAFYQNALPNDAEPREKAEGRMTGLMQDLIRDAHDPALRYMQWRLKGWWQSEQSGDPPPKQVLLFERFYRIHGPDEPRGWDGPFLVPQARWRPGARDDKDKEFVEYFDYTDQRFHPITQ
jgi:hypothetical protein